MHTTENVSSKLGRLAHRKVVSVPSNPSTAALSADSDSHNHNHLRAKYNLVMTKPTCDSVRQLGILGHLRVLLRIKPLLSKCCLMFA